MTDFRSNEADWFAPLVSTAHRPWRRTSERSHPVSPVATTALRAWQLEFAMDYAKPTDVVASMIDAGEKKLALGPRDFLIRGAISGALLGAATTLAFTGAVTTGQPLVGALIFPVSLVLCVTCKPAKQTTSAAPPVVAQAAAE